MKLAQIPKPKNKEEQYLYSIYTGEVDTLPKPYTNTEVYLEAIAKKPGGNVSKPKVYVIKTTDWTLDSDGNYTYTINHGLKTQDIIWNCWELSDGVLTSAVLNATLPTTNTMKVTSVNNVETRVVINAIV